MHLCHYTQSPHICVTTHNHNTPVTPHHYNHNTPTSLHIIITAHQCHYTQLNPSYYTYNNARHACVTPYSMTHYMSLHITRHLSSVPLPYTLTYHTDMPAEHSHDTLVPACRLPSPTALSPTPNHLHPPGVHAHTHQQILAHKHTK